MGCRLNTEGRGKEAETETEGKGNGLGRPEMTVCRVVRE